MTERDFRDNLQIVEGIMDSWLEENNTFRFSSEAKRLFENNGVPRTKAITQTILAWLETKTQLLRGRFSVGEFIEQELSKGQGDFGIGVLFGFYNQFQMVDENHEKFSDELGVSVMGKMIEVTRDSTARQFPQTARLPIESLVIPWDDKTTDLLKSNPVLLGSVMATNLYGRIYGNAFATPQQLDRSNQERYKRIFGKITKS